MDVFISLLGYNNNINIPALYALQVHLTDISNCLIWEEIIARQEAILLSVPKKVPMEQIEWNRIQYL